MEDIVLKKLGLTRMGALNILANKELCERIVNEDVIEIKEASLIYNTSKYKLNKYVKDGKLTVICNKSLDKKGCKKYLFKNELDVVNTSDISYAISFMSVNKKIYKIIDTLSKQILSDKEYYVFSKYNDGNDFNSLAEELNKTHQSIQITYRKSMAKVRNYIYKFKKYTELTKLNNSLTFENKRLKEINLSLKDKIEKRGRKFESWRFQDIKELDLNNKVKRLFIKCEFETVNDVIMFIKEHGFNQFKKFRDAGEITLNSIRDLLLYILINNNSIDYDLINELKNFKY